MIEEDQKYIDFVNKKEDEQLKKIAERFEQPQKVFDVWSVVVGVILVIGTWLWN